jgi:hypothetical protein
MRDLENEGQCPFKVRKNKYGDQNGKTRNPDVIYIIECTNTINCVQGYLTVEVSLYNNGTPYHHYNRKVKAGCVYSEKETRNSTTVDGTTPHIYS